MDYVQWRAQCEAEIESLNDQLELLRSGKITTWRKTDADRDRVDTTAESIAQAERALETYKTIIADLDERGV